MLTCFLCDDGTVTVLNHRQNPESCWSREVGGSGFMEPRLLHSYVCEHLRCAKVLFLKKKRDDVVCLLRRIRGPFGFDFISVSNAVTRKRPAELEREIGPETDFVLADRAAMACVNYTRFRVSSCCWAF